MTDFSTVPSMSEIPGHCLFCFQTPTVDGVPEEAIVAEGVDVNFGDTAYVCKECARLIGLVAGLHDEQEVEDLKNKFKAAMSGVKKLKKQLGKTRAELDEANEKLDKIREGARTVKEVRSIKKAAK